MSNDYKYEIGITFCGEYRDKYVRPFCNELTKYDEFNKDNIFFDEWHGPEINGVRGDETLRGIYTTKCRMIVVLISPNYSKKLWTDRIEWPAIKSLIEKGDYGKICLLCVDEPNIESVKGLFVNQAIYKPIDDMSPKDIAEFLYKSWKNKTNIDKNDDKSGCEHGTDESDIVKRIQMSDNEKRRNICMELLEEHGDDSMIRLCISSMDNNAEKYNLIKQMIERSYDNTVYFDSLVNSLDSDRYREKAICLFIEKDMGNFIKPIFEDMHNNEHMFKCMTKIFEYDDKFFAELYREGNCFTNKIYYKKMLSWLDETK